MMNQPKLRKNNLHTNLDAAQLRATERVPRAIGTPSLIQTDDETWPLSLEVEPWRP